MIDQVLNELSFCRFREPERHCAAENRSQARLWMESLVRTLSTTGKLGLPRSLRTLESLSNQEIAPDYTVAQWRNDSQVSRDLRQLFRQYSTKYPLLDGVLESIVDRARGCEAKFQGIEGKGLLAACLLDGVAISLPSDPLWSANSLEIMLLELDGQGLNESVQIVLHCSSPEHVSELAGELIIRLRQLTLTGRDLLEHQMQLLPNIRFCDDAEAALSTAQQHDQAFSWMRRCLFELNDCCRRWSGGPFPHEELRCKPTPESESISNNPELRRLRTFVCPDGAKRYFQWHLKNFGRNLRLHYFPMKRKELSLSAISADICRRDCTERNQLHVRFNLWVLRFKDRATRAVALRTCTSAAEMVCICAEPQASGLVLIVDRPAFRQPPHCRVAGD